MSLNVLSVSSDSQVINSDSNPCPKSWFSCLITIPMQQQPCPTLQNHNLIVPVANNQCLNIYIYIIIYKTITDFELISIIK